MSKDQRQAHDERSSGSERSQREDAHYARPTIFPWPPVLLVSAVFGALAGGQLAALPWPGLDDTAARIIGRSIGIAGIALLIWAIWTLRQARTTVMPHRGADVLVKTGPYRRFRNPIYLADVMVLLGLAELTKNVWFVIAAFAFAGLVTWLAILPEERHLEARFGEAYRAYKAGTRRWI